MVDPASVLIEIDDLAYRTSSGDSEFELRVSALSIRAGEHVALLGRSGSGKTTLLSLIAGILLPQRGRVRVAGVDVPRLSDAERRRFRIGSIGIVFQEFELLEHLSVAENVLLPYFVNPALTLDAAARARLDELARATGIDRHLRKKPRQLSQGERQRTALCRALVTAPRLLLADEPTGNLDAQTAALVVDLMLEQARRRDATVLCVTHDRAWLPRFDRAVELETLAGARP
jgi:putative ABC transport system ATP-binding protein